MVMTSRKAGRGASRSGNLHQSTGFPGSAQTDRLAVRIGLRRKRGEPQVQMRRLRTVALRVQGRCALQADFWELVDSVLKEC